MLLPGFSGFGSTVRNRRVIRSFLVSGRATMPVFWLFLLGALTGLTFSQGPAEEKQLSPLEVAGRLETYVVQLQNQHRLIYEFLEGWTQQSMGLDPTSKGYSAIRTSQGYKLLVDVVDIEPYTDGQKLTLAIGNPYAMSFVGFQLNVEYGPRGAGDAAQHKNLDIYDAASALALLKEAHAQLYNKVESLLEADRWNKEMEEKAEKSGEEADEWFKRALLNIFSEAKAANQSKRAREQELREKLRSKSESFTDTLKSGSWTKVSLVLAPASPEDLAYLRLASVVTNQISLVADP